MELKEGMTVIVKSGFNREPEEKVVIEWVQRNEENEVVFCYTDRDYKDRWAYENQITRVIGV
jgi:hypothetical protein